MPYDYTADDDYPDDPYMTSLSSIEKIGTDGDRNE